MNAEREVRDQTRAEEDGVAVQEEFKVEEDVECNCKCRRCAGLDSEFLEKLSSSSLKSW